MLTPDSFWLEGAGDFYKSALHCYDVAHKLYSEGNSYGGDHYTCKAYELEEEGDTRVLLAYSSYVRLLKKHRVRILLKHYQLALEEYQLEKAEYERKRGGKNNESKSYKKTNQPKFPARD